MGRESRASKEVVSESTFSRELRVQVVRKRGGSGYSIVSGHFGLKCEQAGHAVTLAGSGGSCQSATVTCELNAHTVFFRCGLNAHSVSETASVLLISR